MIAKRVPRKGQTSSYRDLAHYILDRKGGGAKVRSAWSMNCSVEDDFDLSIAEICATQELNTRSKNDKTYHLVMSLSAGEDLNEEQFREIEARLSQAIGLEHHQRISAIHTDTHNIHMHIALSKVDPLTLNCIEPYYDKFALQEACRELELRFNLQQDVGQGRKPESKAIEVHQGLESFASYIREHIASNLIQKISEAGIQWQEVHALLGSYGVQMRERGAGLIFSHLEAPLFVKASAIDPSFSKKRIESVLGKFETSHWNDKPDMVYAVQPRGKCQERDALYAAYQEYRLKESGGRSEGLAEISASTAEKICEIKARYAKRRLEIKFDTMIAKSRKKGVYEKLHLEMKKELSGVYWTASSSRKECYAQTKPKPWRMWVQHRAQEGHEVALAVLRDKLLKTEEIGLGYFVGEKRNNTIVSGLLRSILDDGTIEYKVKGGIILDRSDVVILKSLEPEVIEAALLVARAKFNDKFIKKGTIDFMQCDLSMFNKGKPSQNSEKDRSISIVR